MRYELNTYNVVQGFARRVSINYIIKCQPVTLFFSFLQKFGLNASSDAVFVE